MSEENQDSLYLASIASSLWEINKTLQDGFERVSRLDGSVQSVRSILAEIDETIDLHGVQLEYLKDLSGLSSIHEITEAIDDLVRKDFTRE